MEFMVYKTLQSAEELNCRVEFAWDCVNRAARACPVVVIYHDWKYSIRGILKTAILVRIGRKLASKNSG